MIVRSNQWRSAGALPCSARRRGVCSWRRSRALRSSRWVRWSRCARCGDPTTRRPLERLWGESQHNEQSARTTCQVAGAAAAEIERGRQNADQAAVARARKVFARAERQASGDLRGNLTTQLRLVIRTLDHQPESPAAMREVRVWVARLAHGLTGVMLACDRAGVRVTIEY